ncbi:hypothetical protein N6H14_02860 [Paenibacillus sp. CC-CFT747]|nr:hypothetical protein N6H14_02860 [Paenibacillus sp. CC-CFT747]
MKNKNVWLLVCGIILFGLLIAVAILQQSAYLLYAASVVPILVVPLMPDIRSNQWLKQGASGVKAYTSIHDSPEADLMVVRFPKGSIRWKRHILYVPIPAAHERESAEGGDADATTITALAYDLVVPKRRKNYIGIRLPNVIQRSVGLPFPLTEVNRIVIRMEDVRHAHAAPSRPASTGRNLQA